MGKEQKTLIYIIGSGRSGTTLLDVLLGNNFDSISLGEINRFYKREGLPPKRKKSDKTYIYWNNIKSKLDKQTLDFKALNHLFKKNEFHTSILKSVFKLNPKAYVDGLILQYKIIKENTDETILIESSKYPTRALNISNYLSTEEFSIKYIYLKKDPVKVIKSFQKKDLEQPSKGFFSANVYYLMVNLLCNYIVFKLRRRKHDVAIVNYEDLLFDPTKTIDRLSKKLKIDFTGLNQKLKTKAPLNTGFLFDGNRIRLKETLTLQPSDNSDKKNVKYYFTRVFNYIVYR